LILEQPKKAYDHIKEYFTRDIRGSIQGYGLKMFP